MNEDQIKQYGLRVAELVRDEACKADGDAVGVEWVWVDGAMQGIVDSVAVPQGQNAQQPAAWRNAVKLLVSEYWDIAYREGSTGVNLADHANDVLRRIDEHISTPPVPRDVLMAAMNDLLRAQIKIGNEGWIGKNLFGDIEGIIPKVSIEAIADRYASNVQPDGNCKFPLCQNEQYQNDMAEALHRELYAGQPEPVNQQLLAALKEANRLIAECSIAITGIEVTDDRIGKVIRIAREGSAIQRFRDIVAAAEAAQSVFNNNEIYGLLASAWFYGDWIAETAGERRMQSIMEGAGWWPIASEDELISKLSCIAQPVAVPDENDDENDPATAVIAFVLNLEHTGHSGEGMEFLRLWNEGEFDVCRREWPDAPPECYIGADPLMDAAQKQEGE